MELKLNKGQQKGILIAVVAVALIAGWQWRAHRSKPTDAPDTQAATNLPAHKLIDLNTADTTALQAVSGIGPATARRIVRYRSLIGGYTSVEQLLDVWGITPENYLRIEEQVTADTLTEAFASLRASKPQHGRKDGFQSNSFRRSFQSNRPRYSQNQPQQFAQAPQAVTAAFTPEPAKPSNPATQAASAGHSPSRFQSIDLNTADSTDLVSVSGIGAATARNILKYRSIIFYFDNLDQLSEVWGIRPENLERMKPHLSVGESRSRMPHLRVNDMSVEELGRHKYLGFKDARILVAYREMHGPFADLAALQKVQGIDPLKWEKLQGYLQF